MIKRSPSKIFFYLLVIILFVLGTSLILNRHFNEKQPWTPGERNHVWNIEGNITFNAKPETPVTVRLKIPEDQNAYKVLEQSTASPGYGLSYIESDENHPIAEWTKREAKGAQSLYYKVRIASIDDFTAKNEPIIPDVPKINWREPYLTAANTLISDIYTKTSDRKSIVRELGKVFLMEKGSNQNLELLISQESTPDLFIKLLNQLDIPAHLVNGLYLEDGRRNQQMVKYIKVYLEDNSVSYYSLKDIKEGLPEDFIIWNDLSSNSLDVIGGVDSKLSFSMIRQTEPLVKLVQNETSEPSLLNFSIYNLPLAEQSVFQTMLLIPLGVLVVVLLRILVGVRTSGTFMPVLLAMSFMETTLITGLIGFLLVVGTGLIIRSYLSKLNLLLVARISAVIITVITIITLFTIASFKLGLTEGLKITYFPIIILSWTIERMSILWEEEGPKEVMIQGGSSLFVAVLVYLIINSLMLRYLVFNFLGLQLILMAVVLLLGSYNGYRLSELKRFSPLVKE